ncbi:MAG: homoserine dehydrogenase [Acidobacteria bacterium]|nr:homoserine dehydrogenase [Acidobacteriota bacterium]
MSPVSPVSIVTCDLILIGFGRVGRRFATLLRERRGVLLRQHGIGARVVGIATRRHGCIYSAKGLNAPALAAAVARGNMITSASAVGAADAGAALAFLRTAAAGSRAAARDGRLVVVETTTLDIVRGEPAIGHVRTALSLGAHVVTANKGPAAFAYHALARAARRAGRRFLFEGAVMDGVPIFNLVRETLPAVEVEGFRGVVNSTTNYMLTEMERGRTFDEALGEMQARGVAEADPSFDVDGWDAAAKTAALANVLLDARMTPHDVEREGLTRDTGRRAVEARTAGRRLKLIARADRDGRRVRARVALEELAADDALARLEGQQNALILRTDLLEEIAVVQRSGSLTQTAYALLSDLVTVARGATTMTGATGRASRRSRPSARVRRSP